MTAAEKVLAVARAEIGYLEKSAKAYEQHGVAALRLKVDYAGSDNYTKYGYDMHEIAPEVMDFPAAWCDAFVDWCFYSALGDAAARHALHGRYDDYTKNSISLYIKDEAMVRSGKARPEPGWQIFFSKDRTYGGIYHTGLVAAVDSNRVHTIEGNTSNAAGVVANGGGVWGKSYPLDDPKIYGYGIPAYPEDTEEPEPDPGWHWLKVDGVWYYQDGSGANSYGWRKIKETGRDLWHWYYFNGRGQMLTGLQKADGSWCAFSPDGDLEGAQMITDEEGYLHIWDADPDGIDAIEML